MSRVKLDAFRVIPTDYIENDLEPRMAAYDISFRALAREMNVDPNQFTRWRKAGRPPLIETVERIEHAFAKLRDQEIARRAKLAAVAQKVEQRKSGTK